MYKVLIHCLLTLCTTSIFGQSVKTLDDLLADSLVREFPKWKSNDKYGRYFKNSGGIGGKPDFHGTWIDGRRRLDIHVVIDDQPEERFQRFFFTRSIMPPNRALAGIGNKAHLAETGQFVDVAFAKENLFVSFQYSFPRPPGTNIRSIYIETAPKAEVEEAIRIARNLDKAITGKRTMTPCHNDFHSPVFPRPATDAEKLLSAAWNGDTAAVRLLLSAGISSSVVDKDGNTPMHMAVRHGCVDTIRVLADAKADLNARNFKLETPLMVAANLRRTEVVRSLLALGADVTAKDKHGQNAAFHVVHRPSFTYLFPQPVSREEMFLLLKVLKDAGIDLNSHNEIYGDTLLTVHTGSGDPTDEWADLIALGVDVNGVNRQGESALIKAIRSGPPDESRIKMVRFLLAHGVDVAIKDKNGFTALDHLRQDRVYRAKAPELVRNIDETIKLLETAEKK